MTLRALLWGVRAAAAGALLVALAIVTVTEYADEIRRRMDGG